MQPEDNHYSEGHPDKLSRGYDEIPDSSVSHERRQPLPQEKENPPEASLAGRVGAWIKTCNELHGNVCVPEARRRLAREDVPGWLIDAKQECLVPGITAARYVALSYAWQEARPCLQERYNLSTGPRTLLLKTENLQQFTSKGFLAREDTSVQIPAVIQHALQLTLALGERYLWVDRLCIVQDDPRLDGTLSQVSQMDKVYAGAYLTIIAAASHRYYSQWSKLDNSARALTGPSPAESRIGFHVPQHPFSPRVIPREAEIKDAMNTLYEHVSRSRWASRGWTYQEQILCRRAVIFTNSGPFWDCQECVWDNFMLSPGDDFSKVARRSDMGKRFTTRWWPDFEFYVDLICPYGGRDFSYAEDAGLAILGILNQLGAAFPGGFIHGLPRLFLDHALLWQPFGIGRWRLDKRKRNGKPTNLPSWSWTSWQGYVDPHSLRSGMWYIDDKECRERVQSLRTHRLVEWSLCDDDTILDSIIEPSQLQSYGDVTQLPQGWHLFSERASFEEREAGVKETLFFHDTDSTVCFRQPIPLQDVSATSTSITSPTYLMGLTTCAKFNAAAVLHQTTVTLMRASFILGPSKLSAFEDRIFKNGPPKDQRNPILILRTPAGSFAGLLRLMHLQIMDKTVPIELIAISRGTINARDIRSLVGWEIFQNGHQTVTKRSPGSWSREQQHYDVDLVNEADETALLCDAAMAFGKDKLQCDDLGQTLQRKIKELRKRVDQRAEIKAGTTSSEGRYGDPGPWQQWFEARNEVLREMRQHDPMPKDYVCEFYNVLWVEYVQGIAYRRALGWAPKHIWDTYADGPVQIKLA